jgi:thioredoxin 1
MVKGMLKMRNLVIALLLCSLTLVSAQEKRTNEVKPKVTFVELGSVTCIPCKQMQPVMKAVEAKFGEQLKVVFYDVNKEENKKISEQYKIKLIPTQVFLDENGKEFFRHQGFYPEKEISKLLQKRGLTVKQ